MSQLVKIKVRPGQSVQFPGVCAYCSEPAAANMQVRKRIGRLTRLIEIPLCADCSWEVHRQSGEEERLQRIGRVASVTAALITLVFVFVLLAGVLPALPRLAIALVFALLLGSGVFIYFNRKQLEGARQEKRDIISSARMTNFSWRATTFEFSNEAFAKGVAELNKTRLMEV